MENRFRGKGLLDTKDSFKRGVFWLIDGGLLTVPFKEGATEGVAKSVKNYNHKLLWDYVKPAKCDKAFAFVLRHLVTHLRTSF